MGDSLQDDLITGVNGFNRDGFLTIEGLIDREVVEQANIIAVEKFHDVMQKIKERQLSFGIGIKNGFKEIVQRHKCRYEMTYGIEDATFDFVLRNPDIRRIVAAVLECDEFIVANRSVVVSEPGCDEQGWHSDGPHMSMSQQLPCHCLNVFVPLVDVDAINGPTEFRPGSHYYTRDLTKQFLLAKIKKKLRDVESPSLSAGSVLLFDYRVLHRGGANRSASLRPVLVFTFAKPWYKDVLNFPMRSVNDTDVIDTTGSGDS